MKTAVSLANSLYLPTASNLATFPEWQITSPDELQEIWLGHLVTVSN